MCNCIQRGRILRHAVSAAKRGETKQALSRLGIVAKSAVADAQRYIARPLQTQMRFTASYKVFRP
jgi:hypothetical protein